MAEELKLDEAALEAAWDAIINLVHINGGFNLIDDEHNARLVMMEVLTAYLSNAAPVGWRTIESAPVDGTKVDLWCRAPGLSAGSGRVPDCWYSVGKWWRYDSEYGDDQNRSRVHNVTHWQPLPAAPLPPGREG